MALVIDSSSPAAASTVLSRTVTTASFTPPDDCLLLGAWAGNSRANNDPPAPTPSSSPSQTWTVDAWDRWGSGSPLQNGQCAFCHATIVGTGPGPGTVSVLNGETVDSFGAILQVYAITGHDPAAPIGVTGGGRANSPTSVTGSYTGSINGGQGFMAISDWNTTDPAAWSVSSGCTVVGSGFVGSEISYMVLRRTAPDGTLGGTTSMTVSGFVGSTQIHYAYVEVISLEAALAAQAAGYPSFGANAPMF